MWLSLGAITAWAQVHSLVRKLRCHGVAKKNKGKKEKMKNVHSL